MNVLSLVTTRRPFFEDQIRVLTDRGVTFDVVTVPGKVSAADSRTPVDYLACYGRVVRRALDDYDLVHANAGLTAPIALAQPHRPIVLTLWGTDLMGRYGRVSRWCAQRCDRVIVMSRDMVDVLPGDATVIPHGVDLERFKPIDQRTAQRRVGWDPDAYHVLFPYPPSREVKNYPLARTVVADARRELECDVELQTVYDCPHDDVPLYLNAADALLLTSDREGSPNSVKEALACNTPIVATPVGDVPDRVAGVDLAITGTTRTELADGLIEVLRTTARSNGREHVRTLSLERMGDRIAAVYEATVDGSPRSEQTHSYHSLVDDDPRA